MYKKLFAIMFALMLAMGMTACGSSNDSEAVNNFDAAIDMDFAKEVAETISTFGDDPVMGMRSAGSPAEKETIDYLEGVMKDIGLQNVTVDPITVDGWTFKGANVTFTNAAGEEQKIDLGGYQTTLVAKDEQVELVYVNEGTAADYEGIDVTGKLVLLDVDQNENWWINYPAYQAKVKGAKAVIAHSIFAEEGDDRVGVQDVCGPADAPALAISNQDKNALIDAIEANGGKPITVTLNCDSQVTLDATSHNIWGEIPGTTDETIFVFSHVDGYFHSQYDDAQGVSVSLAIAKALIDSGYEADKTIRFCFHGAEEWGVSGSEYDWSAGAYEEIMTEHPEWVNGAFAIVNNDGGYTVEGETCSGVNSSVELQAFVEESLNENADNTKYEWTIGGPSTGTEDFMWQRMGIPAIVAGEGDGEIYFASCYHSTYDSWDAVPLDEEGYRELIYTYGKFAIDLDELDVRPMSFTARIQDFEESLTDASEFRALLDEAYTAAEALEAKMAEVESGDDKAAAVELNKQTQAVYKALQDAWFGVDLINVDACIKHEIYQGNLENLDATIAALEAGNVAEAYDEYLWAIDWAWYDMCFDKETTDYMKNQLFENREGTWGEGLIQFPHADTWDICQSLGEKYDAENPDVSAEIAALKEIRDQQQGYLDKVYADEKAGLEKAIKLMNEAAK